MKAEIVVPGPDEFEASMAPVWQAFAMTALDADALAVERTSFDVSRPLAARIEGEWVGVAADYPFSMTLPGGARTPAAGVTMVGVASTHRRQGLLTALMARQLDDIAGRGDTIAILTASESLIYGRFGYGAATFRTSVDIDASHGAYLVESAAGGRCRLLPKSEAMPIITRVYDSCRSQRAGAVGRDDWWWQIFERDRLDRRHGASPLFFVMHEDDDGVADGYATYRIKESWPDDGLAGGVLIVQEVYGASADIEAALWRFLCDVDLVDRLECWNRPLDDPLRWRLADLRRMRTKAIADWVWLRVLDVPAALEARAYEAEGAIVLEVVDEFRPDAGGRFRLEGGPGGATCRPTGEMPHITLGAAELGAMYLGGVAPSLLAGARRVDAHGATALATADALFTTSKLPWANTGF